MSKYLYLSITPEALIASMLPPIEFGGIHGYGDEEKQQRSDDLFRSRS